MKKEILNLFKEGFIKSAIDKGFSIEESNQLYQAETDKYANSEYTPEDYQQIKDLMTEEGYNPEYNMDDTAPYAREYNQNILKLRDQNYEKNPDIEGLKSGIGHGAVGAAAGYGLGHLAGHAVQPLLNPKYVNFAKHLPGWGRGIGLAVGALAGGLPHYDKRKTEVSAAKKLTHPAAIHQTLDQLSKERQYANNQIGNYRML